MTADNIPEVPHYNVYKVENCPKLLKLQSMLAKEGLKDPWIRNEVWRYDKNIWGNSINFWPSLRSSLFRGFKWGLLAFLITIAVESQFGKKPEHH